MAFTCTGFHHYNQPDVKTYAKRPTAAVPDAHILPGRNASEWSMATGIAPASIQAVAGGGHCRRFAQVIQLSVSVVRPKRLRYDGCGWMSPDDLVPDVGVTTQSV